jgi:hypothetical protein
MLRMLATFLSLPVVVESDLAEAYRLAWRPDGAKAIDLGQTALPIDDEPLF